MRTSLAIVFSSAALAFLPNALTNTNATFAQTTTAQTNQFAGATFSPTVAPVVGVVSNANNITLTWQQALVSSGATVTYVVMRSTAGVAAVQVCTGASAPVLQGNSMSCVDSSAVTGVAYTYSEQPIVVSNGQTTWSLDPSAASSSVCLKKCK